MVLFFKLEDLPGYRNGCDSVTIWSGGEDKSLSHFKGEIQLDGWKIHLEWYEDYYYFLDNLKAEKGEEKVMLLSDGTTFSATSEEAFKEVWELLDLEVGDSADV